jgi:uncharacterized membrane protein
MRRTITIVLAAMLASSMAFAQSNTNSGAGVAGKPGSKSGPAMTKSGPGSANQSDRSEQCKGNAWKQIRTSSQTFFEEGIANFADESRV